jgi:hypothetical protein
MAVFRRSLMMQQGRPPGDTWKTKNKGETSMTTPILRAMPLVEMVGPKMQALYLRLTCALDAACSKRAAGARFSRPNCSATVVALRPRTTTITQLSSGHQTIARNASVLDQSESPSRRADSLARVLDVSESRTHGSALQILRAYKLTGNFHVNLEIVLKHLAAFDKVTCEIEPESRLPFHSDCLTCCVLA